LANAHPVRAIFKEAFQRAGLPYFNPHSFRNTLVQLAYELKLNAEQFKAWSQNLGHEQCLTTFSSYGTLPPHRQAEIIRGAGERAHFTTHWNHTGFHPAIGRSNGAGEQGGRPFSAPGTQDIQAFFSQVGCVLCHTPMLKTRGNSTIRQLSGDGSGKEAHLYSDLALHLSFYRY
jgi:hypothetical protein